MKCMLFPLWLLIASMSAYSQEAQLTDTYKKEVIDSIAFQLKDKYVFPDAADLMAEELLDRYKKGHYDNIKDKTTFADSLKSNLYMISKDKHVGVSYDEEKANQLRTPMKVGETYDEKFKRVNARVSKSNYGFEELKIMENNVGYIKLTGFAPTMYGGKTAASAMQFVSNTDALIFDLRANFGGDPTMIQLLISYLYAEEPVHLNNFYHRKEDKTTQSWTLPFVPGKRMPDIPIYVLTDNKTISAGEEFAYNLKNLKRATIVGETTAGAANFGEEFVATGNFIIWIPTGRAVNPITQTNWEGTGVKPTINVKSEDALDVAYQMALKAIKK